MLGFVAHLLGVGVVADVEKPTVIVPTVDITPSLIESLRNEMERRHVIGNPESWRMLS